MFQFSIIAAFYYISGRLVLMTVTPAQPVKAESPVTPPQRTPYRKVCLTLNTKGEGPGTMKKYQHILWTLVSPAQEERLI